MYSRKLINGHVLRRIIPAIAFGLLITAVSAWGDCIRMYPDTDVTTALSASELQNCIMETMVQSYANLLQEQYQLLTSLKLAYSRKLKKMVENASISNETRNLRLTDYDTNLSNLLAQKNALIAWISESKEDPGVERAEEMMQKMTSRLKLLLNNVTEVSLPPNKKVKQAKAEITDSETNNFCKLDFKFRVSQKLNQKIAACLSQK